MFKLIFFGFLVAGGSAVAVSWGGRAAVVYVWFVGLAALTSYGAAVATELLQHVSKRRFAPRSAD